MAVWRFAEQLTKAIKAIIGRILNVFMVLSVYLFDMVRFIRLKTYKYRTKNKSFTCVFDFIPI